jgi:hypothetical protein
MKVLMAFAAGAVIIAGFEFMFEGGSLLYCMLFFIAISQGPIAIMAASDIVNSQWAKPYKALMFSVRHMILFIALLFGVFLLAGKLNLFEAWMHGHQTKWLNPEFFSIRNIALLLLAWLVSNKFAKESLADSNKKTKWALFWLFTYVTSQTIIAFDWVMSLMYPWISTLFGAYFFVEAFYSGLALAAVFTYFYHQNLSETFTEKTFKKSQMDMMTLFFGFSVFWGYQFFSQYLVIWYGNIPEEVAYLKHRLDMFSGLLYLVIVILFVIPFITLMFRKIKGNPRAVLPVGLLVWSGILLERVFMLAYHMPLNPMITLVEFAIMAAVFVWVIRNRSEALVQT